jgi:hypothetical protein
VLELLGAGSDGTTDHLRGSFKGEIARDGKSPATLVMVPAAVENSAKYTP